jgi:hypothetical protein
MKQINLDITLTSAALTTYIPVQQACTVRSVKVTGNATLVATKTIDVQHTSASVNKATAPASGTAAGVVLAGARDASNADLKFDPEATTATEKRIKIVCAAGLMASGGNLGVAIELDELALTTQ